MGFFGSSSSTKVDSSSYGEYAAIQQPGAIPVATPVPEVQAFQQAQHQAAAAHAAHQYSDESTTNRGQGTIATHVPASATAVTAGEGAVAASSPSSPSITMMARVPMLMKKCPNCHQESRTRIKTYPTWQTWTASGVMLFVFWPICWVPLILDNCKQTDHYCVLCQAKVGNVDAFQDCCVTEQQ